MQPQTAIHELFSDPRQNNPRRKTRNPARTGSKRKQTNPWLRPPLETLSTLLVPVTLLVLLWLIVWGLTENTWFALQRGLQPDHAASARFAQHSNRTGLVQPHLELLRPNNVPIVGEA
jgi:hypothetical protein